MRLALVIALIGLCAVPVMTTAESASSQIATDLDATPVVAAEMVARVNVGRCDEHERDARVAELAKFNTPSGEHVGSRLAVPALKSFTPAIPFSLDHLVNSPHAVYVWASGEQSQEQLACGEIAGALNNRGELIIGLREVRASGFTGIAYLVRNRIDASRTNISIFLAESFAHEVGDDRESRGPGAITGEQAQGEPLLAAATRQDLPQPIAYWPLDEANSATAIDDSGHGLDGSYGAGVGCGVSCTLPGGTTRTPNFDGSSDAYVDMGDVLDFPGQTAFSLEAWIAPSQLPAGTFPRIVQKEGADADGLRQGYLVFVKSDTGQVGFERWRNGLKDEALSRCPIQARDPTHVVATYDGETMRLFFNGIEAAATMSAAALLDTAFPFRIGNSSEGTSPFNGSIDEITVYDVALDADGVAARYGAGLGSPSSPVGTPAPATSCP